MDLWYAHQGTTVYKLTKLPEGCTTRKVGYNDSGWTTYEGRSAEQIKKFDLVDVRWKLVLDLGAEDAAAARRWPVGPDDFEGIIKTKTFTNGADTGVVSKLYHDMSANQLGFVEELNFDGMAPPWHLSDILLPWYFHGTFLAPSWYIPDTFMVLC